MGTDIVAITQQDLVGPTGLDSDAFHAALGFTQIGSAHVPPGQKTVRYKAHQLAGPPTQNAPALPRQNEL